MGLACEYRTHEGSYCFLRRLMCLPFLPANHIKPTFDAMRDFCPDHIEPLMDYVNRIWVSSNLWPVESWSVYGQSIRTNNDLEGDHLLLQRFVKNKFIKLMDQKCLQNTY